MEILIQGAFDGTNILRGNVRGRERFLDPPPLIKFVHGSYMLDV